MFDFGDIPANENEYLKGAKADILAATGIPDEQWNSTINDLITGGNVERQGEKRGARYRAVIKGAKE